MSDQQALPEVAAADAPPEIRAIYDQIMRATGVGSPALIYRHVAVFPGFLEWVWQLAGPEIESGHVVRHALAAVDRVPTVSLPSITPAVFAETGVDAESQKTVRAMIDTYNRMNPVNLALFTTIRAMLDPRAAPPVGDTSLPDAPPAPAAYPIPLPAPVDVSAMPEDLRETVRALSSAIPIPEGAAVTPTLYRHFAIWPDFMRHLAPGLQSALDDGSIAAAMKQTIQELQPLIDDIRRRAASRKLPPPPLEKPLAMAHTIDSFLVMIPQLIVVGRALDAEIGAGH